jgi:hypothetical protein
MQILYLYHKNVMNTSSLPTHPSAFPVEMVLWPLAIAVLYLWILIHEYIDFYPLAANFSHGIENVGNMQNSWESIY